MSTLDLFQEVTDLQNSDITNVKRGTVANSDKKITLKNLKDLLVSKSKSIIIENPTAAEDISYFFTDKAITVRKIRAVLTGSASPSVTWTIRHGSDRAAAGSEIVTGGTVTVDTIAGSDVTSFDDATIAVNSHIWVETTAQSGTVNSIIITLFYDED